MWADHAIWWHVYPLGFVGADARRRSATPARLVDWLDYVVELGCLGLLLGPVFASETHGYDTVDHFRIDPRLGDDADFDALVAAATSAGCGSLLDGVFNHVGRGLGVRGGRRRAERSADASGSGVPTTVRLDDASRATAGWSR